MCRPLLGTPLLRPHASPLPKGQYISKSTVIFSTRSLGGPRTNGDPDTRLYDACIHDAVYLSCMYKPWLWCIYTLCMYVLCIYICSLIMYARCIYICSLIMMHMCMMHTSVIFNLWLCCMCVWCGWNFVTIQPTNGQGDSRSRLVWVQPLIGLLCAHLCLGMVDRVVRDRTEVSKYEAQSLQRIECWQQCYNISLFSYIVLHAICNIMACRTKSLLCQFNPTVMVANWRSWWMYPDVSSTQPTVLIKDFV